jgi:hypothetical protein
MRVCRTRIEARKAGADVGRELRELQHMLAEPIRPGVVTHIADRAELVQAKTIQFLDAVDAMVAAHEAEHQGEPE